MMNTHNIDLDFLNLETQDDGPYQPQNKMLVAIDDILSLYVLQTHLKQQTGIVYKNSGC